MSVQHIDIPESYLIVPPFIPTLFSFITGRPLELEPSVVFEQYPMRPGVLSVGTSEETVAELVRFGHYTAKLSRVEYLRLLVRGQLTVPASKIQGTVVVAGTQVTITAWGSGGHCGSIGFGGGE